MVDPVSLAIQELDILASRDLVDEEYLVFQDILVNLVSQDILVLSVCQDLVVGLENPVGLVRRDIQDLVVIAHLDLVDLVLPLWVLRVYPDLVEYQAFQDWVYQAFLVTLEIVVQVLVVIPVIVHLVSAVILETLHLGFLALVHLYKAR